MGSNILHNGVNIRPKNKGLNRELEGTIKRRTKVSSTITNFKILQSHPFTLTIIVFVPMDMGLNCLMFVKGHVLCDS